MSEAADAVVAAYRRGEISAEVAVMRLLLALRAAAAVVDFLEKSGQPELRAVALAHRGAMDRVAALVRSGLTEERAGSIDAIRAQFDAAAAVAPEAAVALYSLGSPDILDRATAEIVAKLREWRLLAPDMAVLDIGCGIGRIARALAPEIGAVTGIDVSPTMVAEARRRCAELANVDFAVCAGRDLTAFAGRRFGLVLAVDAFPYLVAADPAIAAAHVANAAGLLDPDGALVILNYSYRGDLDRDRADVAQLAAAHGLAVERGGTRDLALWDGAAFVLRRPG